MADLDRQLLERFRSYCSSISITDVETLSVANSVRTLADIQLKEEIADHLGCLRIFRSTLVDILEAVKERICGVRNCLLPSQSQKDSTELILCNACVFFATCVNTYPHLGRQVRVALLAAATSGPNGAESSAISKSKRLTAAQCIIQVCKRGALPAETCAKYMFTLRCLTAHGCLGSMEESGMDLGALLRLARRTPSSAQVQSDWAKWGMVHNALSLLCALLHVPHHVVMELATRRMGASILGAVLFVEVQQMAACSGARIIDAKQIESRARVQSSGGLRGAGGDNNDLLDRHFGQSTLFLGGYTLPTDRIDSSTELWEPNMVKTVTSLRNFQHLMQAVQSSLPIIVQGTVGCGKSFMIRELAAAMGQEQKLMELQ